jgi:predicted ATPase
MPVLEALARLSHMTDGEQLKTVLGQHAPTWLAQMPGLLSAAELQALQQRVLGATRERMLREIAEAIEALTAERTLVLVLEDLHWADTSTLELLALLARRRELARMLVIGTYRPLEVIGNAHPLNGVTHELYAHGLCEELALRLLNEEDVATYLQQRFPRSVFPTRLAEVLHRRTEGNPFFLVSVIDDLVKQGLMLQTDEGWMFQGDVERLITEVPESIRHLVARQRERLQPDEQQVLEAASVAGMEFSVAAVAAALETEVVAVGEQCARLGERQQFLRSAGIAEWSDGTVAARYGFVHALYQHLWYERVSIEKQQQWHLRVGMRKEAAYGGRASEIATELAVHFEQGRDYPRAIRYLQQAGENALRRSANAEAISLLTKGLELLPTLPGTPERTRQELMLQTTLGIPLTATKGFAAPEVGHTHNRARELCQQIGETPELFWVLWGLCAFYVARAEFETARTLAEQLLRLVQRAQEPALLVPAHLALGAVMFHLGEFGPARVHLEQVILYGPQQYHSQAFRYGLDPEVFCRSYVAFVLWHLGYPEQALQSSREALTLVRELAHPVSLGFALNGVALLHHYRREEHLTQERAEAAMTLATEHGMAQVLASGTVARGWALATQGQREQGIAELHQGLAAYRIVGIEIEQPYTLALIAETCGKAGQNEEGLSMLAEALATVDRTGERTYEAELYRLKGELTLQKFQVSGSKFQVENPQSAFYNLQLEAEACFLKAIEIARRQQAKSFELRAVMSLARLWQSQGKKKKAHGVLADIYNWFTEGFDTKDLQEAKGQLDSLNEGVKL